tara:strand:+ start:1995 stop:2258 length:264 start_codon:yes stop_codon:yes gene_type:complete
MIRFFKKIFKKQKNKEISVSERPNLELINLEKQMTIINIRLQDKQRSIDFLQINNDKTIQEIQELKKKIKILTHTIRVFFIFVIMKK